MNFDINILDGAMKLIVGITKVLSPLLLKIPVLILIGIGLGLGFLIGNMEHMKYKTKIQLTVGALIILLLLFIRGG